MKMLTTAGVAVCFAALGANVCAGSSVNVGGHAALNLADGVVGRSTLAAGVEQEGADWAGLKLLRFVLFVNASLSERLSFDIRPIIEMRGVDGTTGATPRFGKAIDGSRASKVSVGFQGFTRAAAKAVLPNGAELSAGYVHPRFTWEYGNQMFWDDEINGSPFACNVWLADWSDLGLEYVHYFEPGGRFSLPVYAYLLNGNGEQENNLTPMAMVHAEPDFFPWRFHLSAGGGVWDDGDSKGVVRAAAGASWQGRRSGVRSEFAIGWWQDRIRNSPDDALPHGAYLKAYLMAAKRLRLTLGASYAYHNFVGLYAPAPGEEQYVTITPAAQVLTSPTSRLILQADLCDWRSNPWDSGSGEFDMKLQFVRVSLGWRLTF